MALSNSQYDAIMREYGKQQMENQHSQEARKKEIYQKVPAVKELEAEIAERSVACARKLLEGNQEAIYELREKLADLERNRRPFLSRQLVIRMIAAELPLPL